MIRTGNTYSPSKIDSRYLSFSFEDALLQINNTDMDNFHIDMSEESDETLSCLSNDSKFTAYSVSIFVIFSVSNNLTF